MADGKRVTIAVKVSEETAALIDRARGSKTRSAWLQSAIRTALDDKALRTEREVVNERLLTEVAAPAPRVRRQAPPVMPAQARAEPSDRRCDHSGVRRIGGWCPACMAQILPGGRWAPDQ